MLAAHRHATALRHDRGAAANHLRQRPRPGRGYQVCHKWLKDRKGRTLTFADLKHYQRIVAALAETITLMEQIDEAIDEHGGWPLM